MEEKTHLFPNDNVDPNIKKSYEYGIKVSDAIYSNGVINKQSTSRITKIQTNRDYASNKQSVDIYKPLLDLSLDQVGDTSLVNIDWSISTPCQKFANNLIGRIMNQDYKIQFNSISPTSRTKFENDKNAFYLDLAMQKKVFEMEQETGVILKEKKKFQPLDADEIDLYMDMEYRQPIEIGMEEIVDFEMYNNDYKTKVQQRVVRDIIENHELAMRVYFDGNNKIRLRYADIINYISPKTDMLDNSDVDYEAEVLYFPIRDLKARDTKKIMTEYDWNKVAESCSNKYGNPFYDTNRSGVEIDDFRVPVLDYIWYTTNKNFWEEKKGKNGNEYFDKKRFGYKSENSKVTVKEREVSYEGLRIIGTKYLLDYDMSKNMLRHRDKHAPQNSNPKLVRRYIYHKVQGMSPVEAMRPNINNIQLLTLKKRHLIAEINPTGVAIDISGLPTIMALMKMKNPMDLVKIYKQKGIKFYTSRDQNDDPTNSSSFQEITNDLSGLLTLDQSILSEINLIRENIGINDAVDGNTPNKDALIGIEKLKLLASSNTTRQLYDVYTNGLLVSLGKVISRMVQYKIMYGGGIEEYEGVIGKYGVNSLEFVEDIQLSDLGIKIEALPSAEELQDLLNALTISLQNGEIGAEDVFEIKRVMNIKKAIRFLTQKKKKLAQQKMAEFQQKEQITAEREGTSAMAAAEATKVKLKAEADEKMRVLEFEYKLKADLDTHLTQNKIKVVDKENYWEYKKIEKAQENDKENGVGSEGSGVKVFQDPERSAKRLDQFM